MSYSIKRRVPNVGSLILFLSLNLLFSFSVQAMNELVVIHTKESGMHRISYEQIANAGVDLAGLKHGKFALLSREGSQVIRTKGARFRPGRFGAGGFIEFYAEPVNDLYNDQRAYVLVYDRSHRRAMRSERARADKTQPFNSEYIATQTLEQNNYYDYLSPSATDPWHFGQLFSFQENAGTSVAFDLPDLIGDRADLSVQVYGIVDIQADVNDHHIAASINGVEVGDEQFDGNVAHSMNVENVSVNAADNAFRLSLKPITETPLDAVGLNKISLRYLRQSIAQEQRLEGEFTAGQAQVSNVGTSASVYRKTQDGQLTYLRRVQTQAGVVSFKTKQNGNYIVVGDDAGYISNVSIEPYPLVQDIKSGQAEYLILTHASFKGAALDTLAQLRASNYSVKVVDVAQVYAQFGDTLPSADAIAAYVRHAAQNMGTRFVTLIGSDTYDYKNYANSNSVSFVPTRYAATPGGSLYIRQTPSDASYGDVDQDGVPDIAVGRISVRTAAELATVVEKIQDYQAREAYAGRILIAADQSDLANGINFNDDVVAMIEAIPQADWQNSVRPDFRALPDVDGGARANQKVINAINAGVSVAAYIGHSSQQQWSRATPAVFTANDIAGLNNIDKPTIVMQWGCWNTYFVDPDGNNMADLLLVGSQAGAATVLGASTLTSSDGEAALGVELNQRMFSKGKTIGEAVIEAKQALAANKENVSDILLGWQIIGDPALVINP